MFSIVKKAMLNTSIFEGKEYVSLEDYNKTKLEHDTFLRTVGVGVMLVIGDEREEKIIKDAKKNASEKILVPIVLGLPPLQ